MSEELNPMQQESQNADQLAYEINFIKRQTYEYVLKASVDIGERLTAAKELVPHGQWTEWLAEKVDYSQSTANNFMRIYREYSDDQISMTGRTKSETFASLSYSQAVALFSLPEHQREEFVEQHDVSDMSIKELKEAIAAQKAAEAERDAARAETEAARILCTFAGSDNVQNIPGLTVTAATHTDGVDLNLKDNLHDFWDLARKAIQNDKIAISCEFDPMAKTITAVITNHAGETEITIEADLPNVTEQKFTLRDDYGSVNKVVVYNAKDDSQSQTFYASDYAPPVVQRVAEVTVEEGETFAAAAREKSAELMRKSDADNLIELTFRRNDRMIPDLHIGQPVRILKGGKEYHTILTGKNEKNSDSGGYVTLIFGGIRVDFTKILKLKGAI